MSIFAYQSTLILNGPFETEDSPLIDTYIILESLKLKLVSVMSGLLLISLLLDITKQIKQMKKYVVICICITRFVKQSTI